MARSFLSSPIATVAAIAAAAAITAGLLLVAGVSNGESRSEREARLREERINRTAESLAAEFLRESPSICDFVSATGPGTGGFIEIGGGGSTLSELSQADLQAVSGRLMEELKAQCRKPTGSE